jgi:soluble lytic murein transglycosylase-like protein
MREGRLYVTNAPEPNPPLKISDVVPAAAEATQTFDNRMPAQIQSLVHTISKTHGVDPQLVAAVMRVESNYDRLARSSAGALGLMQLMPATGARFGVREFFDPEQNIEGGVKYLRFLSDKFGPSNIDLITAAYNAGENRVERVGRRVPAIPETVDYVRKIQKIYKPGVAPSLVSASDVVKPNVEIVAPEPQPAKIYKYVDERGVLHFSNVGPPR